MVRRKEQAEATQYFQLLHLQAAVVLADLTLLVLTVVLVAVEVLVLLVQAQAVELHLHLVKEIMVAQELQPTLQILEQAEAAAARVL